MSEIEQPVSLQSVYLSSRNTADPSPSPPSPQMGGLLTHRFVVKDTAIKLVINWVYRCHIVTKYVSN